MVLFASHASLGDSLMENIGAFPETLPRLINKYSLHPPRGFIYPLHAIE